MQNPGMCGQPTQLMGEPGSMPNSTGNSAMGPLPQVMLNPGPSLGSMHRPTEAWEQLLQALKSPPSAQQQQKILAILKSNPQLMPAFIKQITVQQQQQQLQQLQQQEQELQKLQQEEQELQQLQQQEQELQKLQQEEQQLQQLQQRLQQIQISEQHVTTMQNYGMCGQPTQHMGEPGSMANFIGNSAMGPPPQVMPNPGPSLGSMQKPTEVWRQLLQVLNSPPSAQQQQQVLAILRSNPQVMAAFIKERARKQQQQQQQQLQLQQLQQRLQQIQISKQHIAAMQNHGMCGQLTQLMGEPGSMANSIENSAMGPPPQVMSNPGSSLGSM